MWASSFAGWYSSSRVTSSPMRSIGRHSMSRSSLRAQVVLVADLQQLVPIDLASLAATMAGTLDLGFFTRIPWLVFRHVRVQAGPTRTDGLALPPRQTLSPPAIGPTLVPCQFVQRGGVLLLQFLVRGGRFAQHAVQFRHLLLGGGDTLLRLGRLPLQLQRLLKSGQQESVAVGQIVRK